MKGQIYSLCSATKNPWRLTGSDQLRIQLLTLQAQCSSWRPVLLLGGLSRSKPGDLHCSPLPWLALLINWHSILTQTTHKVLVSQLKSRLPSTILSFTAVSGYHTGASFQLLCSPVFSLLLPSSCPCCNLAELLPMKKEYSHCWVLIWLRHPNLNQV